MAGETHGEENRRLEQFVEMKTHKHTGSFFITFGPRSGRQYQQTPQRHE